MKRFIASIILAAIFSGNAIAAPSNAVIQANNIIGQIKHDTYISDIRLVEKITTNSSVHQIADTINQPTGYVEKHIATIESLYDVNSTVAKRHYVYMVRAVWQ